MKQWLLRDEISLHILWLTKPFPYKNRLSWIPFFFFCCSVFFYVSLTVLDFFSTSNISRINDELHLAGLKSHEAKLPVPCNFRTLGSPYLVLIIWFKMQHRCQPFPVWHFLSGLSAALIGFAFHDRGLQLPTKKMRQVASLQYVGIQPSCLPCEKGYYPEIMSVVPKRGVLTT